MPDVLTALVAFVAEHQRCAPSLVNDAAKWVPLWLS